MKSFKVAQPLWLSVVAEAVQAGITFTSQSDIEGVYVSVPDVHEAQLKSLLQGGIMFSVTGRLEHDESDTVMFIKATCVAEAKALFEQRQLDVEGEDDPDFQSTCTVDHVFLGATHLHEKSDMYNATPEQLSNAHIFRLDPTNDGAWREVDLGEAR